MAHPGGCRHGGGAGLTLDDEGSGHAPTPGVAVEGAVEDVLPRLVEGERRLVPVVLLQAPEDRLGGPRAVCGDERCGMAFEVPTKVTEPPTGIVIWSNSKLVSSIFTVTPHRRWLKSSLTAC